jgi:hypothetical protein
LRQGGTCWIFITHFLGENMNAHNASEKERIRYQPSLVCPSCQSDRIHWKNHGRRIGGAVGTLAGATAGLSGATAGAETGALIGMIAGPAGVALGSLAGAIFGGLLGASVGCTAGSKAGEVIDATVLENLLCLSCGYEFDEQSS